MATAAKLIPLSPQTNLKTQQFYDALHMYIDQSKPDLLAKNQMKNLRLYWDQTSIKQDKATVPHQIHETEIDFCAFTNEICGRLTLSSEYISIILHTRCHWKTQQHDHGSRNVSFHSVTKASPLPDKSSEHDASEAQLNQDFDHKLYFRLGVSATFISLNEYNKNMNNTSVCTNSLAEHPENAIPQKIDRKKCSMNKKLRSGMLKRMRTDPLIRKLLIDEDSTVPFEGLLLCEALIQQSAGNNVGVKRQCEERVNVNSDSIEGIRNAIFSHCDDNLDVLEVLLSMPYLPRSDNIQSINRDECNNGIESKDILQALSTRVFLRILEDAMFDACEKEGEDEMLDDLNISDERSLEVSDEDGNNERHAQAKRRRHRDFCNK